jgi:hypothetical protein
MNNFADYLTPEQAYEINKNEVCIQIGGSHICIQSTLDSEAKDKDNTTLAEWKRRASIRGKCIVCKEEDKWRYADTDMCFSCTTGEADASGDYELLYIPRRRK